jgi:thymidylate synthase (FAD)
MEIKVSYIDHMGNDLSVVNSARVSFGKRTEGLGYTGPADGIMTPVLHDKDVRLIRYLVKHGHHSPFNHTYVTMHCKAPIFVARQLQKHSYMPWNEISRRYVSDPPQFYRPETWRGVSEDKKQGSQGTVEIGGSVPIGRAEYASLECYQELLRQGVAPEQARMVLPQSMTTEWFWSGTIFAWSRMCNLRLNDDSQYESRILAKQASEMVQRLFPISWESLVGGVESNASR